MCGNHLSKSSVGFPYGGSPPRVREPLEWHLRKQTSCGITPACAGTTHTHTLYISFPEDHPRVCGNHSYDVTSKTGSPGSPPRVREPPLHDAHWSDAKRITPACAGTTCNVSAVRQIPGDHPRVCGNHM